MIAMVGNSAFWHEPGIYSYAQKPCAVPQELADDQLPSTGGVLA